MHRIRLTFADNTEATLPTGEQRIPESGCVPGATAGGPERETQLATRELEFKPDDAQQPLD